MMRKLYTMLFACFISLLFVSQATAFPQGDGAGSSGGADMGSGHGMTGQTPVGEDGSLLVMATQDGKPAANVDVQLIKFVRQAPELLSPVKTNAQGEARIKGLSYGPLISYKAFCIRDGHRVPLRPGSMGGLIASGEVAKGELKIAINLDMSSEAKSLEVLSRHVSFQTVHQHDQEKDILVVIESYVLSNQASVNLAPMIIGKIPKNAVQATYYPQYGADKISSREALSLKAGQAFQPLRALAPDEAGYKLVVQYYFDYGEKDALVFTLEADYDTDEFQLQPSDGKVLLVECDKADPKTNAGIAQPMKMDLGEVKAGEKFDVRVKLLVGSHDAAAEGGMAPDAAPAATKPSYTWVIIVIVGLFVITGLIVIAAKMKSGAGA